jgi:hypothetical protein
LEALRTIVAIIIAATGIATLLSVEPIPLLLADAGVPDAVGAVIATLMIANAALILIDRFAFVATIVPMSIAFFWFATGVRSGHLLAAVLALAVLAALVRVARATRPAGLAPLA